MWLGLTLVKKISDRILYYHKYMSKYEQLWQCFKNKDETNVDMSFDEIKGILGFAIDHSFLNCKKELEEYGYKVKKIYLKEKRVVFEKITSTK